MLRASYVHCHLGLHKVARLTTTKVFPAARHIASATPTRASATVSAPRMGRGAEGAEPAVSSAGVIDSVAKSEQNPIRFNPRSDKFGVQRFHHVEFWTPDATGAAKRLACAHIVTPLLMIASVSCLMPDCGYCFATAGSTTRMCHLQVLMGPWHANGRQIGPVDAELHICQLRAAVGRADLRTDSTVLAGTAARGQHATAAVVRPGHRIRLLEPPWPCRARNRWEQAPARRPRQH